MWYHSRENYHHIINRLDKTFFDFWLKFHAPSICVISMKMGIALTVHTEKHINQQYYSACLISQFQWCAVSEVANIHRGAHLKQFKWETCRMEMLVLVKLLNDLGS